MTYEYNPLLKYNFQKKSESLPPEILATPAEINQLQGVTSNIQEQINNLHSDSKDIDVSTLAEFESAINSASVTNSIRIHLRNNISLVNHVNYNLDYVQIIGHDFTLDLNNYTFTITGQTCYFSQIRIAATLTTTAESVGDYDDAHIIIRSNVSSSRFFFEYVVFRNFVNYSNDIANIFLVFNISGTSPSLHLYFMFTEVMTNYQEDNINTAIWCVYNGNSRLHALTVHNIDFWGAAPGERDKTNIFAFRGASLSGAAKLAYIQDGSSVLNTTVPNALTPNFINKYNPGFTEYQNALAGKMNTEFNYSIINNSGSYQGGDFSATAKIYSNNIIAFIEFTFSCSAQSTYPDSINILNTNLKSLTETQFLLKFPPGNQCWFKIRKDGYIVSLYGITHIATDSTTTILILLDND